MVFACCGILFGISDVIAQMTGSSYMVKASSYVVSWNVYTVDRNVVESTTNI